MTLCCKLRTWVLRTLSDPAPGKHINLALMLTDGSPNVNNGANRTFEVGDLTGYNSADGREYAAQMLLNSAQETGCRKWLFEES